MIRDVCNLLMYKLKFCFIFIFNSLYKKSENLNLNDTRKLRERMIKDQIQIVDKKINVLHSIGGKCSCSCP